MFLIKKACIIKKLKKGYKKKARQKYQNLSEEEKGKRSQYCRE